MNPFRILIDLLLPTNKQTTNDEKVVQVVWRVNLPCDESISKLN